MDYVKGDRFFTIEKEKIKTFPYLDKSIECEVLIIGGGIDGAIANFYLSENFNVVLVDKAKIGYCCTCCATALLEYQLDDFAEELSSILSEEEIVKVYKLGLSAIDKIDKFIKNYGNNCYFARRPSLLYTPNIFNTKKIEKEFLFRKKHGFNCKLITKDNNPFPFKIKKGLYCEDGGAEFDPYLFTKQMIENCKNQNNIYENTEILQIKKEKNHYIAKTDCGKEIKCKKIIVATGFNWELLNKENLCERTVTYSLVSSPMPDFDWYKRTLIQDVQAPYHYLRLLPDNRIIIGGEDSSFKTSGIKNKTSHKKYKKLEKHLNSMFGRNIKIDYQFSGSFGNTPNNLGLMGKSEDENILYFISCGANGILNAMFAVDILESILKGEEHPYEKLFSPVRDKNH